MVRVNHQPYKPPSSARVTEIYLWLTFHFLVEQSVFRGFPKSCQGAQGGGEILPLARVKA